MNRTLRIAVATVAALAALLTVSPAAQARDTGWDCPGCKHAGR